MQHTRLNPTSSLARTTSRCIIILLCGCAFAFTYMRVSTTWFIIMIIIFPWSDIIHICIFAAKLNIENSTQCLPDLMPFRHNPAFYLTLFVHTHTQTYHIMHTCWYMHRYDFVFHLFLLPSHSHSLPFTLFMCTAIGSGADWIDSTREQKVNNDRTDFSWCSRHQTRIKRNRSNARVLYHVIMMTTLYASVFCICFSSRLCWLRATEQTHVSTTLVNLKCERKKNEWRVVKQVFLPSKLTVRCNLHSLRSSNVTVWDWSTTHIVNAIMNIVRFAL